MSRNPSPSRLCREAYACVSSMWSVGFSRFSQEAEGHVDGNHAWVWQSLRMWEITAVSKCCIALSAEPNNCHLQELSCACMDKLPTAGLLDGWGSLLEGGPEKVTVLVLNSSSLLNQLFAVCLIREGSGSPGGVRVYRLGRTQGRHSVYAAAGKPPSS